MSSDTVEVHGVELDAEDTLEAAQAVANEPDGRGAASVGDVTVVDDSFDDEDVFVATNETGLVTTRVNVNDLIEDAEAAIEPSFVEYLEGTDYLYSANDIESREGGGEASISYLSGGQLHMEQGEFQGLLNDENVHVLTVTAGGVRVVDRRSE